MATVEASQVRIVSESVTLILGGRANLVRVRVRVSVRVRVRVRVSEPVGDPKLGGVEGDEQVDDREQVEGRVQRGVDDGQGDRLQ